MLIYSKLHSKSCDYLDKFSCFTCPLAHRCDTTVSNLSLENFIKWLLCDWGLNAMWQNHKYAMWGSHRYVGEGPPNQTSCYQTRTADKTVTSSLFWVSHIKTLAVRRVPDNSGLEVKGWRGEGVKGWRGEGFEYASINEGPTIIIWHTKWLFTIWFILTHKKFLYFRVSKK